MKKLLLALLVGLSLASTIQAGGGKKKKENERVLPRVLPKNLPRGRYLEHPDTSSLPLMVTLLTRTGKPNEEFPLSNTPSPSDSQRPLDTKKADQKPAKLEDHSFAPLTEDRQLENPVEHGYTKFEESAPESEDAYQPFEETV